MGERWTLLIIRDALLGITRFEGFRDTLGIPRNVLTARLNLLVEHGVLERVRYQQRPARYEYRLTGKGRALSPVVVTLMNWGDEYYADDLPGPPTRVVHEGCGGHVVPRMVCERCQPPLRLVEVSAVPAGWRRADDQSG
ncbi:helix-turn-helix domain-containing protein [Amycolatopsis cihanbeyliensis]